MELLESIAQSRLPNLNLDNSIVLKIWGKPYCTSQQRKENPRFLHPREENIFLALWLIG